MSGSACARTRLLKRLRDGGRHTSERSTRETCYRSARRLATFANEPPSKIRALSLCLAFQTNELRTVALCMCSSEEHPLHSIH